MVLGRLEPEASPHWSQASSLSAEARHNFLDELAVVSVYSQVRMFRLIFSANTISSRLANTSGIEPGGAAACPSGP